MRVLYISYPTAFQTPGGGEMQMLRTFEEVKRLGIDAHLFNIFKKYTKKEIDFLHIFSVHLSIELIVTWANSISMPYVVSPIFWPTIREESERQRIRYILLNAKKVLPNSYEEIKKIKDMMEIPDNGQFVKIINGIDLKVFENINRSSRTIQQGTVLSIGNIDSRKNLHRLSQACGLLNMKLIIAGAIRDKIYFDKLISENYCEIIYIGHIDHGSERHKELLSQAQVFALPSEVETPGIAAIEAGSAGVPVVITSIGPTYEYFGSAAFYCDPLSVESIANAIKEAKNKYATLPKSEIDLFRSFTWERAGKETVEAYKKLLINNG
jgi:glycosyltransferase involved in cell wall biosynthesis